MVDKGTEYKLLNAIRDYSTRIRGEVTTIIVSHEFMKKIVTDYKTLVTPDRKVSWCGYEVIVDTKQTEDFRVACVSR